MLLVPLRSRRTLSLLFVGITTLLLIYSFREREPVHQILRHLRPPSWFTSSKPVFPPSKDGCAIFHGEPRDACADFPTRLLTDVQIVFKTGIGERDRARVALETYGSCIGNLLVVSDAPDRLAGHDVVDIIADLPSPYAASPDWSAYNTQKEAFASGNNVSKSDGGWKLDRFKFLAMVDKAFEVNPYAKWYVFTETDIYIFWDTLFRSLNRLDSSDYHLLGAPSAGSYDRWFAYGGAGFVMSRGLMRKFLQNGKQKASQKYAESAINDCCGDAVLAYAIFEELKGTRMESLYPTFSGEDPLAVTINSEKWCVPLLSFHRVSAETMEDLWKWERCRPYTASPITYSSFLDFGLTPLVQKSYLKERWDNGADERQETGYMDTAEACSDACDSSADCLQFTFREGSCFLGKSVKIGRAADNGATSGWHRKRLAQLGYEGRNGSVTNCKTANWLEPKIMAPKPPP